MSFPSNLPIISPIGFFPPGAPMIISPNISTPPATTNRNEKKNRFQIPTKVFVGSISDRAPDAMIKRMLHNCGTVLNWKRVLGANGKLQAFGFCEYENPEGTLRCIRLLNGWQIQDKNLVIKVDSKTKTLLNEFKKKKRHEIAKKAANDTTAFKFIYEDDDDEEKRSNSTNADGKKKSGEEGQVEDDDDDYLDNETRREDAAVKQSLETIMKEYSREMNQRALEAKEAANREAQTINNVVPTTTKITTTTISPITRQVDSTVSLNDEEGKRNLITNQIIIFRDRFKDEETKMRNTEKERKGRYERERALKRETEDKKKSVSPSPRNNTSNSIRSRTRDRWNSPSSTKYSNDEDDDDEEYEKRKQERRLREKELRYRDRLKLWEQHERRKKLLYEDEKHRELTRLHEEEKEGKRLLGFLEDYNDETDDPKYYKGTALARRLKDREHEIEIDNRDRRHEKEEIEILRQKLLNENNVENIQLEIKRRLEKEEESIRKRLANLIRSTSDESDDESDDEQNITINQNSLTVNSNSEDFEQSLRLTNSPKIEIKSSPRQTSAVAGAQITGTKLPTKRKLTVNEVFRDDQDDENTNNLKKKSKLLLLSEQQSTINYQNSPKVKDEQINRLSRGKTISQTSTTNVNSTQSQEEKHQIVRKLIESIPKRKEDLFSFPIDWSFLDSNLMEKRIKPWVTKKIVEYIGEEEATLRDFICSSIMSRKTADSILEGIRVVLDDEAEVFVVKMWRLIVYEIEAKRNGLSK